jgi:WD40 repeat protein/tetratricopeptide (TPR) repeat protein
MPMRVVPWKMVVACVCVCVMAMLLPAVAKTQSRLKQQAEDLQGKATALFNAKKYADAAETEEKAAKLFESAERKEGKTCDCAAYAYGGASWYALFAKQPQRALLDSEQGHRLYPDALEIETNRAHALLFLNKTTEAIGDYLAHKGQLIAGRGLWEQVILRDFTDLRAAGVDHPQFKAVEQALIEGAASQKKQGWLGARLDELTLKDALSIGLKAAHGAKITQIASGSPAEKAGLNVGDILASADGKDLGSAERYLRYVLEQGAEAVIKLSVKRAGSTLDFSIELAEQPPKLSVVMQSGTGTVGGNSQNRSKTEIVADPEDEIGAGALDVSPNSALLASGGLEGNIKIVQAISGIRLRTLLLDARVSSLKFSADSDILSFEQNGELQKINVVTAQGERVFGVVDYAGKEIAVRASAFSNDVRRLAFADYSNRAAIIDIPTGSLHEMSDQSINAFGWSKDGSKLAAGADDGTIYIVDGSTGNLLKTLLGHEKKVTCLRFSMDGVRLLSGSDDGTVKLWDVATGQLLNTYVHGMLKAPGDYDIGVEAIAFSEDEGRIISGGYGGIKIWDVNSRAVLKTLPLKNSDKDPVASILLLKGTKTLILGILSGELSSWSMDKDLPEKLSKTHTTGFNEVAFSPDGNYMLAGARDGSAKLWSTRDGRLVRSFKGRHGPVLWTNFSADGRQFFTAGSEGNVEVWDTASGKVVRSYAGTNFNLERGDYAFSEDGRNVLVGEERHSLKLINLETGKITFFEKSVGEIYEIALSPDGSQAISRGENDVKIWDSSSGKLARSLAADSHDGWLWMSASKDFSKLLLQDLYGSVKIVDLKSGKQQYQLNINTHKGQRVYISAVTNLSPDGSLILSAERNGLVNLWEVKTGRLLYTVNTHMFGIIHSVFSPDGSRFIVSGLEGDIPVYSTADGAQIATHFATADDEWLTLTPAGFFAASAKGTDVINVVRGLEPYSAVQFYEHLYRPDLVAELLKGDPEGKYQSAANQLNLEKILDSGPAPKLERLNSPAGRDHGNAIYAIRLIDTGGGIGDKVIWRVNGVAQGRTTIDGGEPHPGRYIVMEQTLNIDLSQKNDVEVVAYNRSGLLATRPLRFTIDPVFGAIEKPKPHLYVLAVGVDRYVKPDWRLSNAVNDAKSIGDAFKAVGGAFFGEANVDVIPILDESATREGLDAAFSTLGGKVQPQDVFVLFLSGHGRSIAGDGSGTGWFFLPQNLDFERGQTVAKDAISSSDLEGWLRKIPASKSVIVLDACESGAFEAPRGNSLETETAVAQFAFATGRSIISAAPAGKAAYEGYRGHGLLTYAILEGMNAQEGAPAQPVTLLALGDYVGRRVIELSEKEFGIVQAPRTEMRDNFPLGIRQPILKLSSDVVCQVPVQSSGPSHVTSREVDVRENPADDAAVVTPLSRNALVTVTKCDGPWALIARGGKDVGYVKYSVLEPVN